MKKLLAFTNLILLNTSLLIAQDVQFYHNDDAEKHLIGEFPINYLKQDTTYSKWYEEGYADYVLAEKDYAWAENLKDDKVEIYMGTWCGDSQEWVPRFIKLWDELGLSRDQLKIMALYGSGDHYKQGPNGEEKGLNIHRVPTFIFKEDGKEYARIVESPSTNLLTDVAQIALGYPSAPNYAGATYLLDLFAQKSMKEIYNDMNNIWRTLYYKVGRYAELNTLGNVLYAADKKEQAQFVFNLNTAFYPGNWRVQKRFAEILAEMEYYENAITFYEKVVQLNPDYEEAKTELERIKQLQAEKQASSENEEETKKDAN